jgi:hypothetical protein
LAVGDTALTATADFYGIYALWDKTAGDTDAADDFWGLYLSIQISHADTIGKLRGGLIETQLDGGIVDTNIISLNNVADLNTGTVNGSVYGIYATTDVAAGMTAVTGSIYGMFINVNDAKGISGTAHMLYLNEQTGVDYGIYQNGTADNYLQGDTGINALSPAAKLHVDQDSTTGAKPTLYLDQADLSEEFIEFNTTIGTGNPTEAIGGKSLTTTHFVRVTITGVGYRYIPVGTIA